jgi:hypothetical protein
VRSGDVHALTRRGPAWAAAGAGLLLAAAGATAAAAPCGRPDLVDMVPPDGAVGVATDATLAAHYASNAEYLGEPVVLVTPDGLENGFTAAFDSTEGLLSITPPAPLAAGASYEIRWPAIRGLNAAAPGNGGTAQFTVGGGPDQHPPTFAGVTGIDWDVERSNNECTDAVEERMVFDLDLGTADDDGGRGQLTLLLYQTAGPQLGDASVPVLAQAMPPEGTPAHVGLPTNRAVGHVCFAALVRDLTGKVSDSGDQEVCAEVTTPPFFRGCSITGGRPTGAGTLPWLLALLVAHRRRAAGRRQP